MHGALVTAALQQAPVAVPRCRLFASGEAGEAATLVHAPTEIEQSP